MPTNRCPAKERAAPTKATNKGAFVDASGTPLIRGTPPHYLRIRCIHAETSVRCAQASDQKGAKSNANQKNNAETRGREYFRRRIPTSGAGAETHMQSQPGYIHPQERTRCL